MDVVDLLTELVAVPSVNPACTTDSRVAGEQRLADFLAEYLEAAGFEVTLDAVEAGRPNLLATWGSGSKTLLLEAHLDTVGVENMARDPFRLHRENGRLYGRGACDCKGPIAAALASLTPERMDTLARKGYRLVVAAAMGEETGNMGAARMVERGLRAHRAVVLEPTDLSVVRAHRGALWVEFVMKGRAAHGSVPQHGVNAIVGALRVISEILTQHQALEQQLSHELLGGPSLSVGQIHGGVAVNIVPDHCVVRLDRRTLPGETTENLLARWDAILRRAIEDGFLLGGELKVLKDGPPFVTDGSSALVQAFERALRSMGRSPVITGAGWYSDAGPLSPVCDEIVVFGPGSIRQAHTADEFVAEDELRAAVEIFARLWDQLPAAQEGGS